MNSQPRVLEVRKPQFPPDFRSGVNKGKYVPGTYSPDGKRIGDSVHRDKDTDEVTKISTMPTKIFWWATNTTGNKLQREESRGKQNIEDSK